VERRRRRPRSRCRVTATPIPPSHPQSSDREFFRFFPCLSVSTTCVIRSSDDMSKPASFASALANPHFHTSPLTQFSLDSADITSQSPPSQQSSFIHRQSSFFFVTRNSNFILPKSHDPSHGMRRNKLNQNPYRIHDHYTNHTTYDNCLRNTKRNEPPKHEQNAARVVTAVWRLVAKESVTRPAERSPEPFGHRTLAL
jgi:hypothetical protein